MRAYLEDLAEEEALWGILDGIFAGIAPLLVDDSLDVGLLGIATKVIKGHDDLKPFFTKEDAGDDPDWPELPIADSSAAKEALESAAEAVEKGPFGAALPKFLRDGVSAIEFAKESAFDGPDAEAPARKSGGRAVYLALGVLSSTAGAILKAAGNVSSIASYLATEAGQGMLTVLGAAWQTLMRLVGLL